MIRPGQVDEDRWERSRRIPWIDLDAIASKKVMVVGAGALGNEVVKNLVLSGFHRIDIIDMDRVVRSNLNRCVFFSEQDVAEKAFKAEVLARKASALCPEARVEAVVSRVEEVEGPRFEGSQMVIGCLDNISARLHLNAHCCHHRVPLIDGGTMATSGKVQVVIPPEWPCLQCAMNLSHFRVMEKRFSCSGAESVFFEPKMAAEITTTSVVAAIQVREAVKALSGRIDRCIRHVLHYDGLNNRALELEVQRDPECQMHF